VGVGAAGALASALVAPAEAPEAFSGAGGTDSAHATAGAVASASASRRPGM